MQQYRLDRKRANTPFFRLTRMPTYLLSVSTFAVLCMLCLIVKTNLIPIPEQFTLNAIIQSRAKPWRSWWVMHVLGVHTAVSGSWISLLTSPVVVWGFNNIPKLQFPFQSELLSGPKCRNVCTLLVLLLSIITSCFLCRLLSLLKWAAK